MAFFLRMDLFLVLYDWFAVNRWFCWFLSHVDMFDLQSSESFLLLLSHRLPPSLPSLSSLSLSDLSFWQLNKSTKTNPPRWHQISSGTFLLFYPCNHLLLESTSVLCLFQLHWGKRWVSSGLFVLKGTPPPPPLFFPLISAPFRSHMYVLKFIVSQQLIVCYFKMPPSAFV